MKTTAIVFASFALAFVLHAENHSLSDLWQLDQFNEGGSGVGVVSDEARWQTFTVGLEGALRGIELHLFRGDGTPAQDFTVSVFPQIEFAEAVASVTRNTSELPMGNASVAVWLDLPLDPIEMAAGSEWRVQVQQAPGPFSLLWTGDSGATAPYSGGTSDNSETWSWHFRTYMDPYTIPEPGTYAALVGLAALGFVVWRRKRIKR